MELTEIILQVKLFGDRYFKIIKFFACIRIELTYQIVLVKLSYYPDKNTKMLFDLV